MSAVIERATADATVLSDAGFDGIMVENFGDAPFYADDVPKVTIAAMTAAISAVAAVGLPTGVNVLRNDGLGRPGCRRGHRRIVRSGQRSVGHDVHRSRPDRRTCRRDCTVRQRLCPDTAILADVFVKHATPPAGLSLADATNDLVERAGADAVVVSGAGTGAATSLDDLSVVVEHSHLPVFVGSGATAATIAGILALGQGAIVGSDTKVDGIATNPVDPERAEAVVRAALR